LLLTKIYPLRTRVTDFAHTEFERKSLALFRTALVERSTYCEMFSSTANRRHSPNRRKGQAPRSALWSQKSAASSRSLNPNCGRQADHETATRTASVP
jgi:hypothetical protein